MIATRVPRAAASGLVLLLALAGCSAREGEHAHAEDAAHAGHEHEDGRRGPRGGRLLEAKGFQLELVLSGEAGTEPTYTGYLYDGQQHLVRPSSERLSAVVRRLGGRRQALDFRIDGDHFHSTEPIAEPHAFRMDVRLQRASAEHTWSFEEREGRIELPAEAVAKSGIVIGTAGPATIEVTIDAPGEVRLNHERVVQIRPRFPGQVRELRKPLGSRVERGEVIAIVHSNESLADYAITAPTSGTIVARDAAVGQAVAYESVLYTVADLSTVWVDFPIYSQNVGRIRVGQPVRVQSESGPAMAGVGTIRYVGPLLEQDTRVSYGRIVLDNRDHRWQPGLYVACAVTVENVSVPLAAPEEAIVRLREGPAVFRAEGTLFEPQPVAVGRSDGRMTEIVTGLEPGARIVVRQAFLLKAELGKGEAGHAH
jgi:cobalt-zinc-cadmium efflux system membrane fusion protein